MRESERETEREREREMPEEDFLEALSLNVVPSFGETRSSRLAQGNPRNLGPKTLNPKFLKQQPSYQQPTSQSQNTLESISTNWTHLGKA